MTTPQVGCPKCGTILNAEAAMCDGTWHEANKHNRQKLQEWLEMHSPTLLQECGGDIDLAAYTLLYMARDSMAVLIPYLMKGINPVVQMFRDAGLKI